MRHVVFWQTMPSPHMAGLMRCLSQLDGYSVCAIFSAGLSEDRVKLGWDSGSYGSAIIYVKPTKTVIEKVLASLPQETIHIFSGINYDEFLKHWYLCICNAGLRAGVLSEGRDSRGLKGIARRIDSHLREFPRLQHADFILAIGRVGRLWYANQGLRPRVYDFAYVVETQSDRRHTQETQHATPNILGEPVFSIIFVGRLIELKGTHHLLKAVARFKDSNWRLTIIGHGPEKNRLLHLVNKLQLQQRVEFLGALPNNVARGHMRDADVMAFPSTGDGWGAVVNEALSCGTPVICTDFIGASDLIRHRVNGSIYRCGDITSLQHELLYWRDKLQASPEIRESIREKATAVEPGAIAKYLSKVIDHVYEDSTEEPIATWRNHERS